MDVKPNYCSMESVFSDSAIYKVPKYQRAYSWEPKHVKQFTSDIYELLLSYKVNNEDQEITHFFGGVVCVKEKNEDSLDDKNVYVLVDGQQRLSTMVLFVSRLIVYIKSLNLNDNASEIRNRRVEKYKKGFILFTTEENDKVISYPRISLSKRDFNYYDSLIKSGEIINSKLKSHELLAKAAKNIDLWLKDVFCDTTSPEDVLSEIEHLYKIVSKFCKILIIRMSDVNDAYKLFQVINDRGRSLTASDLLRASSLGTIDSEEGDSSIIHKLEVIWDEITENGTRSTDEKLIAYYTSKKGKSCQRNSLFENFNRSFFLNPKTIGEEIENIKNGIDTYDMLSKGIWPYENSNLTGFQKRKLYNLIVTFKHSHCIPLLMAATSLKEKKFYQLIFFLEKFFFIFKVALKKRMTAVTNLYYSTILKIISNPNTYQPIFFVSELQAIFKQSISVLDIKNYILNIQYVDGGDNRSIKYIFSSLEESYKYLSLNINSAAKMYRHAFKGLTDDYSVFTIEHIYPQNSMSTDIDEGLEILKNSMPNLTILYGQDNEEFKNSPFSDKKNEYKKSRLNSTTEISKFESWTKQEINLRKNILIDNVVNVFGLGIKLEEVIDDLLEERLEVLEYEGISQ